MIYDLINDQINFKYFQLFFLYSDWISQARKLINCSKPVEGRFEFAHKNEIKMSFVLVENIG